MPEVTGSSPVSSTMEKTRGAPTPRVLFCRGSAAVQKLPELGEFLLRDVGTLPHGLVDLLGTLLDRAADAGKDLEEPARLAVGLRLGDGGRRSQACGWDCHESASGKTSTMGC